ncbi:methyltransferase [Nocardiopsis alborubida]|uniref:Methyltransferase n=1 Tax=Nocardiopsis alborubida TaxID=146802 RepID=A0A7X6MH34_9ACTN|nr:methyltransferase [Nocardiopsis alborubida]NKY99568.1 methyltransferase [Nocardiopsis alborubida]
MDRSLVDQLPPPLPAEQILAVNPPRKDLHTTRSYTWNGWEFEVPPGVFLPGGTSRMVHQRILEDDIDVRGRRYAAMGVGLGVEAVAAGARGADRVHAADVHAPSVEAAARNFAHLLQGRTATELVPVTGDMFEGFPDGTEVDVVTFNPPAVSQAVSTDPDVVRNVCVGAPVTEKFFSQLAERPLLAPGAEVFLIASNTADLRRIVGHAEATGFRGEVHHRHDWGDGVLTYLFRFREETAR